MKRMISSRAAKIAAVCLLTVAAWAAVLFSAAVLLLYERGYYEPGVEIMPGGTYDSLYAWYPYRFWLLGGLAAAAALCVLLLLFLLASAGHRRGTEGICLGWLDRLPLDLTALVLGGAALWLVLAGDEIFYTRPLELLCAGLLCTGAFLLCLALLLSVAARLKAGKWWENTAVYWVLKRLWLLAARLPELICVLPLVWRTALLFCGVTAVNFIMAVVFFVYGESYAFFLGVIFNAALLVCLCRAALDLQRLKTAGARLAEGDVAYKTDTRRMFWDFKRHGENLNRAVEGMSLAVSRQMKSERLKTELITNVSHDIKTPLTSIVNYVDLLSKEGLEGQAAQYLEVLERQTQRLRKLTEDLVEASKASTGNLAMNLMPTDLCELVRQAAGEYAERLEEAGLELVSAIPEEPVHIRADGRLIWRVLDNLLGNAVKYALPGTRVYLNLTAREGDAAVAVKNTSRDRLNVEAEELMERFVRGEGSRTTEGSGLGLNIARSLVELQQGSFALYVDGDFFKAELRFARIA